MRLVGEEEALAIIPAVYDAMRSVTPGAISRTDALVADRSHSATPSTAAAAPATSTASSTRRMAQAEGYAVYRIKDDWDHRGPKIRPGGQGGRHHHAAGPPRTVALPVRGGPGAHGEGPPRPGAQPAAAHPPRAARPRAGGQRRALGAPGRPAGRPGRPPLRHDRLARPGGHPTTSAPGTRAPGASRRPASRGRRWHRSSARRTTPDLVLDTTDLAAIYLGGIRPTELAEAGRIEERTPGALRRADVLFAADRTPWCVSMF